jgi:hypothetical protein
MQRFIMPRIFSLLLLLTGIGGSLHAQSIDDAANKLFFNVFKNNPDTSIRGFLRNYLPGLLQNQTGNSINAASAVREVHAFLFSKHPFLNAAITGGKLEFFCLHAYNSNTTQVYDVKLWLEFESQQTAEMAYNQLIALFDPLSSLKRFSSSNGAIKAEFSDAGTQPAMHKIRFRLTADNLDNLRFKILFESGNDL